MNTQQRCWKYGILVLAVAVSWPLTRMAAFAEDPLEDVSQETLPTFEDLVEEQAAPEEPTADVVETTGSSEATTPQPALASTTRSVSPSGTISVDFKDADIRQVLRILSLKSGVDIVAGPDVEGVVTIKLTNVPWEQALDIILRTYGFAYERKGNVVRVLTQAAVEQEALATEVFPLDYATAKEVSDVIKEMLSDRGKVKFDERTNTMIVTDLPSTLFQLKAVIVRLDQATPQVYIESKIVETSLTRDDNVGIDWTDSWSITNTLASIPTTFPFPGGAALGQFGEEFIPRAGSFSPATGAAISEGRIPQVGGAFTYGTIAPGTLNMTINAIKSRTNTNIISNPTIMTLNNKEAYVQVGEDVNIPNFQIDSSTGKATVSGFQTRPTGVILRVTPHVNPSNEIVLDLKPEITEVKANFDTFASGVSFPRFTVQKAETQVRMKDGQTLVIGGLVKRKKIVTDQKVPFFGDLPLIGMLFSNHAEEHDPHQDLLIFLTVRLVKEEQDAQHTIAKSAGELTGQ